MGEPLASVMHTLQRSHSVEALAERRFHSGQVAVLRTLPPGQQHAGWSMQLQLSCSAAVGSPQAGVGLAVGEQREGAAQLAHGRKLRLQVHSAPLHTRQARRHTRRAPPRGGRRTAAPHSPRGQVGPRAAVHAHAATLLSGGSHAPLAQVRARRTSLAQPRQVEARDAMTECRVHARRT